MCRQVMKWSYSGLSLAGVIGADDVAATIGTVPHEILCRTGSRIVRSYDAAGFPESDAETS